MKKIRVRLQTPFEVKGLGEIKEIEIRDRVTVGDLIKASKAGEGLEADVALLASLCGLLPEDLHNMDEADYAAAYQAMGEAKKARSPQAAKQ